MAKKILFYLGSGDYPNPFDCLLAYDNGYDNVINYFNVDEEKALNIVQNIVFARSKENIKNTVLFVGGSNTELAKKSYKSIKMFLLTSKVPQVSVVFDPNGIYTTTAAILIKMKRKVKDIAGQNVVIFGGTGSIGQCIAGVLAEHNAHVEICSRNRDKLNGVLSSINSKNVTGFVTQCVEDMYNASRKKDIIITSGPPGVTMLKKKIIEKLSPKIIIDISAIKPLGIENFNTDKDLKEIRKKVTCIIGEEIGVLKNNIERKILKEVLKEPVFYERKDILALAK